MRSRFLKSIFSLHIVLVLSFSVLAAHAQSLRVFLPEHEKEWQRVITDSFSNIDVASSSLVFEPNGVFRATFRTILSRSEDAFEKPGVKYKTRLETIQFDSHTAAYRSVETTLRDSSEKVVFASGPKTGTRWKPLGITAEKMYGAALRAGPFSAWRIVGIRYADGREVTSDEDAQLARLHGADVMVGFDRFWIGRDACTKPSYESALIGDDEFRKWTGKSLKDAGFTDDKLNALKITCEKKASVSELNYLFLGPGDRSSLLSGGVLIDLEKK